MTDTVPSDTGRAPRAEKVAVVDEVRERLQGSSAALLTEYRGLKVSDLAALRVALTAAGADFKVYKNTLVRFAVRDLGLDIDDTMLTGPTAIAFVDGDAAAVAKALRDYARTNPLLVVKGGILGDSALSADQARALADLPSRELLLARLAGGLAAPMVGFAGLLQALPRNFAYGLKALIDQGGAPGADGSASGAPSGTADGTADAAPGADGITSGAPSGTADAEGRAGDAPPATDAVPAGDVSATTDAAPAADIADDAPAAEMAEAAPAADHADVDAPAEAPTDAGAPAADDQATEAAPAAEALTDEDTTETPEEAN